MRIAAGAPGARILALGEHQPATVVTNHDLAARMDTSDEWIRTRVGIASRRVAGPDESVVDMAVTAGGKALAASGLSAADIDLVIVATCTMPSQIPNAAPQVATRLGIRAPGAYDLNAACAGFCYGLSAAAGAVTAGAARNVLLIGSEKLTDWVDRTDRSTAIIFADGAGAAVVGPAATPEEVGIGPVAWGSAGERADTIHIKDRDSFLWQEGQAVFRWATTSLAPVALRGLRAGRGRGHRPGRVRPAPGQPAHHRGDRAQARRARTPWSPPTSSRPATPRPRPSRWPWPGWSSAASCPPARRCCCSASAPGSRTRGRSCCARDPPLTDHNPTREEPPVANEEIRTGLAEILEEVAGVLPADVSEEKSFTDDLDVDSLSMVEIALAAEERFGVKIPDDELANLRTVGDAVGYIEKAQAAA